MYKYYFMRWYSKGLTDDLGIKLDFDKYEEKYDKLISENYVLKLYHVTSYPREMIQSVYTMLRNSAPSGCYVDIYTSVDREVIDWSSPYMQKVKKTWEKSIKEHPNSVKRNALNSEEDYKSSARTNDAIESWNLVSRKTNEGHATVKVEIVMLCFIKRPVTMKELLYSEQELNKNCGEKGISITQIKKNLPEIINAITPTSPPQLQPVKMYSTVLDENVALYETYTSGKIGGKKIYLGREVGYGMFVFEDLLNTKGGALNILLAAMTGAGKSFYIKFLVEMLLDAKVNVIIWDKDGEYATLCEAQGMSTIHLGVEGGRYYNTVPISIVTPNGYTASVNDTLTVFEMLADVNSGMTFEERYLFNLAYNHMLGKAGVEQDDKSTWKLSSSLTYLDVYRSILEIEPEVDDKNKKAHQALCDKLFVFFDKAGMHKVMFKEPLNVERILEMKEPGQPMMLCINMQSKGTLEKENSDKLLDKIKSHTMSNVSSRIIDYNKRNNEFTALVVEEMNRHLENKNFITMVNDEVTGGRKRNLIPILATNSINGMVNSNNQMLQDIVDNMDTVIVGALNSKASTQIQERYSLQHCSKILDLIKTASDENVNSKYKNAFLIKTRTELAVVKATVPPHLAKSQMFKTRDITEE